MDAPTIEAMTKGCTGDCAISTNDVMQTSMYYPPIYGKDGKNRNPDFNRQNANAHCHTCNKRWRLSKLVCEQSWDVTAI